VEDDTGDGVAGEDGGAYEGGWGEKVVAYVKDVRRLFPLPYLE
jgi:hypothetical protein